MSTDDATAKGEAPATARGEAPATARGDPPPSPPPPRRLAVALADDRELLDDPDGPFGNKGGLYIESRIRVAVEGGDGPLYTVTSPTITTPLAGVPEPFLAGHYMKVLCPLAGPLAGCQLDVVD